MGTFLKFLFFVFLIALPSSISDEFCHAESEKRDCEVESNGSLLQPRYIFYDVNPPEGFNLRRDVYMRMAVFVKKLRKGNWILVLPPWPHLYHWISESISSQNGLPWSLFFNVSMLSSFVPVIEQTDFLKRGHNSIEQIYVLQHFKDTFTSKNFKDRMKIEPCIDNLAYDETSDGYVGHYWSFGNITAKNVECLSFHGPASQLSQIVKSSKFKTVMFDHAEVALHDRFGDKNYWDVRRSMKFADHLLIEAETFRKNKLNSTNEVDGTIAWPNMKRTAHGGNYICVHLRRRDFLYGRSKDVPSIKGAADQIDKALNELNLQMVFVATDAPREEKLELKNILKKYKVMYYAPGKEIKSKYKDGGIAIIEQIICSHARKFYGTHESTFSFRIQEEREIMGFKPETTFNRLCGDKQTKCKPPPKWLIVY